MLEGKRAIVFGERDDVSGLAVRTCLEAAGVEVVYESTSCFVWTSAGAAGLAEQQAVKELAERYGSDDLIVVFGLNEPANLRIMATTFRDGDPSFAGALGGVALGLRSYHILELKPHIPDDVWQQQMAMEELEIEDELAERIRATLREIRGDGD